LEGIKQIVISMMKSPHSFGRFRWALLATLLPMLSLGTQAQDVNSGMVALWTFDKENFQDSVAEFHGEANGSDPIEFTSGRPGFGQSMILDGIDQMVEIVGGEPDDLSFEGGSMSLSVWFKIGEFDKNWQALVAKGEGTNWRTHRRGGEAGMAHAGGIGEGGAGEPISVDEWHHLVAVSDVDVAEWGTALYIDGELYSSNPGAPNMAANGQRVMIGENPDARNRYWNGEVDEVALWDRVLTESEIVSIFQGGTLGAPATDADGDGMSDAWETKWGFDINDPSDAAEDADGDGITNLAEFESGGDPTDRTAPSVLSAETACDLTTITLGFSENLDEASAADAANYSFDSGLAITDIAVKRKTVTLTTAAQDPSSTHVLTINNIVDLSKNSVATTLVTINACEESTEGVLLFQAWNDIPGAGPEGLQDPKVPEPNGNGGDAADFTGAVFSMNSQDAWVSGPNNNYVASMTGFITPTVSGDYNFFIRSDDASELWISTDDDPSNVVFQAEELDCCDAFQELGVDDTTTFNPIAMEAGQRYYIDARYNEGGGGDWMEVAWALDGEESPANELQPIGGEFLSSDTPALVAGAPSSIESIGGSSNLKDGLVALWNFDGGDFSDSVGAFHGEGNGTAAIQFAPGQPGFGQSIVLDGVDQMVEIVGGEPDDLAFEGGSTSISAWFKVGAFDKNWQAMIAKGEGSNWRIARRGGGNVMSYAGGIGDTNDAGPDVNDGQWHHLVAVTDAEGAEFGGAVYIDGELAASTAGTPALAANGMRVMIGDNPDARGRNWNGELDDIGIWNRALSASEIASIAGGDPIGGRAIPAPLVTDELVALWDFNGGDFTDSVGEFHGEGSGTEPIQFIPGRDGFGQALRLDGTDQMVEIIGGEPDDLAFEGGSVSIGAWFRVGEFDKNWQAMIAKGEGSNWRVARRGGSNLMSYAGGIGDTNDAGPDVNDGEWHHLLAVTDAEGEEFGGAIYIDGELAASTAGVPALAANGSRVIIGDNPGARGRNWNGDIDDVAIWGRVLSASEVASIAAGGPIGGPVGPGVPPVGPPPVPGLPPIVLPPIPGQQPGSITGIARAVDGSVSIEYTGTLQAAESVTGPYAPVAGASSPYAVDTTGTQFYIAR